MTLRLDVSIGAQEMDLRATPSNWTEMANLPQNVPVRARYQKIKERKEREGDLAMT